VPRVHGGRLETEGVARPVVGHDGPEAGRGRHGNPSAAVDEFVLLIGWLGEIAKITGLPYELLERLPPAVLKELRTRARREQKDQVKQAAREFAQEMAPALVRAFLGQK
jgi:hypothetical protein